MGAYSTSTGVIRRPGLMFWDVKVQMLSMSDAVVVYVEFIERSHWRNLAVIH
jgi:hypothetical protein